MLFHPSYERFYAATSEPSRHKAAPTRLPMSVRLHFNSATTDVPPGDSLFTCGERLGARARASAGRTEKAPFALERVLAGIALLQRASDRRLALFGKSGFDRDFSAGERGEGVEAF